MKVLFGMRMKALVLGMVVVLSVGASMGTGHNEDAFDVLCNVLRSAEKVMNKSGQHSGRLKEALYGKPGGVVTVEKGQVSVKGNCNGQTNRGPVCTYYNGGRHGCFAESLAGTLLCTCTPGQRGGVFCGLGTPQNVNTWSGGSTPLEHRKDLFQKVWDEVRKKCPYGTEHEQGTREDDVGHLEKDVQRARDTLKQGLPFFYFGGRPGRNGPCSGAGPGDVCAAFHQGRSKGKHTVHIPWADTIKNVLPGINAALEPKAPHTVSAQATPAFSASTAPAIPIPSSSAESKESEVEPLETSTPTDTTSEEETEETHTPGTPSPEHPGSPKGRARRSTTEGPETTSTATEDTSNTDEPEILDPTAAPFPLADGADLLTPLGLFMAASSFF
ncbi:Variant surface glycoprotein [Trypanosoma congolense IL3000]|uniref:Variant surface glycoprotein n=1 Tax=Trypanosoma congolense (strain IL3000) TaxID=1068625 RepID=F9WBT0_TRYCI|nr:Variant surface glycoprotein [Trypanosoma congolense IL3000]